MTQPADRRLLTEAAGNATYADRQVDKGLSFDACGHVVVDGPVGTDPAYLDNIGDNYLYGSKSRQLFRATSESGPWQLVHDFGTGDAITGIRDAGDGEVLVIRSTDGVWKSTGWSTNPVSATWRQVLVTNGRVPQFSFDVDPASGWATCTTYINGDMTNSRFVWLSKNHGNTWSQIFDMAAEHPELNQVNCHMHFAVLDPRWNPTSPRIWISYHKTNQDPTEAAQPFKRVRYSDDAGATWSTLTDKYQPVAAASTPSGMVFASDESVVGVYRALRTPTPAEMTYDLFYAVRRNIDGIFGWGTKIITGRDGAYHIAFRSSVAGVPARVVTTDGYRIAETLQVPPASSTDTVDLVDIVEHQGRLLAIYYNTATGGGAHRLRADAPRRGVPPTRQLGGVEGGVAGPLGVAVGLTSLADMRGTSLGSNSWAGMRATAVGEQAFAAANGIAIGSEAKETVNGVAIGTKAVSAGGVAVGRVSVSVGTGVAVGDNASAENESVGVGSFVKATGTQATALGRLAEATGQYAVSVGQLAKANKIGAVSIGRNTNVVHDFGVAIGYGITTTAPNQFAIGGKHIEIKNSATPSTPPTGGMRLFSRLNGSSKVEVCVQLPTGPVAVLATEA